MPLVMAGTSDNHHILRRNGMPTLEAMACHDKAFRDGQDGDWRVIDDGQQSRAKALNAVLQVLHCSACLHACEVGTHSHINMQMSVYRL